MDRINPIFFHNTNQVRNTNFKAHPDFDVLKKRYEITASSWFRRGQMYGSPADEFEDVINCLQNVFKNNKNKKTMLIAGIGESQEPFSLLAVIKAILGKLSLKKQVDLYIVDLQSKPDRKTLFRQSFYNSPFNSTYVPESFIKDDGQKYGFWAWMKYRVKDEIFKFLNSTYKNPEKAKWDTRLQEAVKEYPKESFDIISINNTIGYISSNDVIRETMKNIIRIMKKGGVFITDPHSDFNEVIKNDVFEVAKGIFIKR